MGKTRCKIKFNQHMSDEFKVKTGLQQGDALFPVLFNIALELAMIHGDTFTLSSYVAEKLKLE